MDTEFVELHKPCPVCNSSDACSINEDGSAKCFSCDEFFPDYYKTTGEVKPMTATATKPEGTMFLNTNEVLFSDLDFPLFLGWILDGFGIDFSSFLDTASRRQAIGANLEI